MNIPNSSMERTAQSYIVQREKEVIDALNKRPDGVDKEKALAEAETQLKKAKKVRVLKIPLIFTSLFVVALIIALIQALFFKGGFGWLFIVPELTLLKGDIAIVMAPLITVAISIERLLEVLFDTYEQSLRAVADVLATPKELLDWVGREYQEAYEAAQKVADNIGVDVQAGDLEKLEAAEQRLAQAEVRLDSGIKSPEYLAVKRAICIFAGLFTGLLIAILGDIGMLRLAAIPVPRLLDMIVTGFVIGSGPGPIHSIIGLLQNSKDAVGNLSELAKGKAIKDALEELTTTLEKQK